MKRAVLGIAAVIALSASGFAQVTLHQGASEIVVPLGLATFDGLVNGSPLQNYQEDGLRLDVDDFAFVFTPAGFNPAWGPPYYPNAGVRDLDEITRIDGQDFNVLEMNMSHGFGGSNIFAWIQAYLNGGLVDQFDVDFQGGTLIGLTGVFDEVRIGSYGNAATRDLHDPTQLNAVALDNVEYGLVPEPASIALLSLGALALLRR